MIFIKRLSTIGRLDKRKEDLMQEVVRLAEAKVNIAALSLHWLHQGRCVRMLASAQKLQRFWRQWLDINGPRSRRRKWMQLIDLYRNFGTALPIAHAYAMGFLARREFAPRKSQEVRAGRWGGAGGGLIKRRRSKRSQQTDACVSDMRSGAGEPGLFNPWESRLAGSYAAGSAGLMQGRLLMALNEAAIVANKRLPPARDQETLGMPTRRYINCTLKGSLVRALKALQELRPSQGQLQHVLLAALQDKPLPAVPKGGGTQGDSEARYEDYLRSNGGLTLLKPALFATDRHRPDDPSEYLALFISVALERLFGT